MDQSCNGQGMRFMLVTLGLGAWQEGSQADVPRVKPWVLLRMLCPMQEGRGGCRG